MKKLVVILLCLMFLTGCIFFKPPAIQPFSKSIAASMTIDSKIFKSDYKTAWSGVMEILEASRANIASFDESSGTIIVGYTPFKIYSGFWDYAQGPKIFLATWVQGRYKANIKIINISNERTQVRLDYQFEALETEVTNKWHTCKTKGVLENEFFDKLENNIGM
ncbi:hypothetical protein ACFL60_00755 [Candidatus Omnitrophota bacterium]